MATLKHDADRIFDYIEHDRELFACMRLSQVKCLDDTETRDIQLGEQI